MQQFFCGLGDLRCSRGVLVDCVCGLGCFNGLELNRKKVLIVIQVFTLRFAIDFLCVRLTPRSQLLHEEAKSRTRQIQCVAIP